MMEMRRAEVLVLPKRETAMMNRRNPLVLGVLILGLFASSLPAQKAPVQDKREPVESPSHQRLVGGGIENMSDAESALTQRLNSRRIRNLPKLDLDEAQLRDLAKRFLKDEKFLESIKGS